MMEGRADYLTGWIDTSVYDFVSGIDEPVSSMAYALVTCLDSSTGVADLRDTSRHLEGVKAVPLGSGLLLTTRQLLAANRRNRIFFGFDEVWFFPDADIPPKPAELGLVGPHRVDNAIATEFAEWLRASRCSLGLGDGTGMNFCLRVRGVAKIILQALNEAGSNGSAPDTGRALPHAR